MVPASIAPDRAPASAAPSRAALSPAALIATLIAPVAIITIGLWPSADRALAVAASPFSDPAATAALVAAAGGAIVAATPLDNVVIARATTPDFVARLYQNGAWLVVDAPAGCANEESTGGAISRQPETTP